MNPIFIPKEHPELPDAYQIKVDFITGGHEEFEIASHMIIKEFDTLEFVTREDEWFLIPLGSIKKIKFDKQWSKIVSLKRDKKDV